MNSLQNFMKLKRNFKKNVLFFCVVFSVLKLQAQEKTVTTLSFDTLYVKNGNLVLFQDSIFIAKCDTFLLLPDSVRIDNVFRLKDYPDLRNQIFYDTLQKLSSKRRLTKELFKIFIPKHRKKKKTKPQNLVSSELKFIKYNGKIIRKIIIKKLNVFGSSVIDTSYNSTSWLGQTANKLHIQSRNFILKDNLLFASGDKFDAFIVSDNERIIRELPYIKDARICVKPLENTSDSVDICLITKDIWSIGVSASIRSIERYKFGIYDENFMGVGRKLQNNILINTKSDKTLGYKGYFKAHNIGGSFIAGELSYINLEDKEYKEIAISRRFISPEIRNAGGAKYAVIDEIERVNYQDTLIRNEEIGETLQDFWLARSFPLSKGRTNIVASVRYSRKKFNKRPPVDSKTFQKFYNSNMFLASFSLNREKFYNTNMIYSFGKREDIPYGFKTELLAGCEKNDYTRRFYTGVRFSIGQIIRSTGFVFAGVEFGSFIRHEKLEQGVFDFSLRYFSEMIEYKRFRFRQFLTLHYTRGFKKLSSDSLSFNNKKGIRGLSDPLLHGDRRLVLKAETLCFLPADFYGFKFALYGFADIGFIRRKEIAFRKNVFSGFGLGIRIRNENLVFKTLQLRLAYYPRMPNNSSPFSYYVATTSRFKSKGFSSGKPELIDFD